MEKVSSTQSQSIPVWERQKSKQGHHSGVQAALQAHRERVSERESRTQQRLDSAINMQNEFFQAPQASEAYQAPSVMNQAPVSVSVEELDSEVVETPIFNPRQIDTIYNEAQLGTSTDKAILLVNKEVANPEDGPIEDVPKGSYIDYTV